MLNIGRGEKIPKCPVEGHRWKGIIHNNCVTWLAFWKENVQDGIKYVFLHPSSRFKGQGDMDKFEKARMLHNYIDTIRTDYNRQMRSKSTLEKQRSTALWIIDHLALRVGNEKNEDEADTVCLVLAPGASANRRIPYARSAAAHCVSSISSSRNRTLCSSTSLARTRCATTTTCRSTNSSSPISNRSAPTRIRPSRCLTNSRCVLCTSVCCVFGDISHVLLLLLPLYLCRPPT